MHKFGQLGRRRLSLEVGAAKLQIVLQLGDAVVSALTCLVRDRQRGLQLNHGFIQASVLLVGIAAVARDGVQACGCIMQLMNIGDGEMEGCLP